MHKTAFIYGYLLKQGAGYHLKGTEMPWAGAGIGAGVGAGASGLYDKLRGGKINKTRMAILAALGGAVGGGAQFANKGFRGYKGPAALKELAQSALAPEALKAKTMEEFFQGARRRGDIGETKPSETWWRDRLLGHKMERAPGSEQDFKDWLAKEISSDKEWSGGGGEPTDLEDAFYNYYDYKNQPFPGTPRPGEGPRLHHDRNVDWDAPEHEQTRKESERLLWLQRHLPEDWWRRDERAEPGARFYDN